MTEELKKRIKHLEAELKKKEKALHHIRKAIGKHDEPKSQTKLKDFKPSFNWKIFLWIIPIAIILYLICQNFIVSHDFKTLEEFNEQNNFLTPTERVSWQEGSIDVKSGLVYFDANIPKGSDDLNIALRVKDNLPKGAVIKLGTKINESWAYNYETVYNQTITGIKDDGWLVLKANFKIDNSTYVKDDKLNIILSAPFADKSNLTIDWILVEVHKDGIFER